MIITKTPVRISFLGGGTDYPEHFQKHGGSVLVTTIDKYSYLNVKPLISHFFDYDIRISYITLFFCGLYLIYFLIISFRY